MITDMDLKPIHTDMLGAGREAVAEPISIPVDLNTLRTHLLGAGH